ncbi:MAG: esterase [Candidatus Fluviicola riflensis]|nr:MAG: esterase [Candidatus Fluviicola riflensis]OGS76579.1 MAG: esterase [Candidatus Fluviicola riflensis]OGS83066.1 MAG: esterase [Fluviicola sp. RIFCSPHIGHO2_01_FULL_43_53]OGS88310.1 MAG: esterase [Fluviicola sp. RIFCSPHIGHO2_12_FULL_43_24]
MKQALYLVFLLFGIAPVFAQKQAITLGFSDSIPSSVFGNNQTINIYLPDGYHPDSAATYPVIYLLDGAIDEDFIHIAGLVQFNSFSWVNYLQPSILVGIVSTNRKHDMTFKPAPDATWPTWLEGYPNIYEIGGGSEKFMSYIEKDLQPFIEKNYKTNGTKTLIGQSLAGLFATEILFKKPELFQHYCIVSPSLWWDNGSLLKQPLKLPETPMNVYIAVGDEGKEMVNGAKNIGKALQKTGQKNMHYTYEYLPEEDHGTILHEAVGNAFEWLAKLPVGK